MAFLLIPKEISGQDASIWLGIVNENVNLSNVALTVGGSALPLGPWLSYSTQSRKNKICYQHVIAPNLAPRTEYDLALQNGNQTVANATIRTLPITLPTVVEDPFTVLLGSCFCSSRSESFSLGTTYLKLQNLQKTDLKILCGDQVYLDDPALYFTWNKHTFSELEDKLFSNYLRTWTQMGSTALNEFLGGYQQFLQNGGNFFSSDDHEFWNNAPNWATLIPDTWTQNGRNEWMCIAKNLLAIFQTGSAASRFNIGDLSFFIADTRVNRNAARINFMSAADLSAIDNWVTNLSGVGVLVLGQPIFSKKAGWKGNLVDWNLPDYQQYEELVKILFKANHSILVLTGDVHYGRISHCQLKDGVYLYEIISSPTTLVNPAVRGRWSQSPDLFPASSIPGVVSQNIVNNFDYKITSNHFLTLSFYKDGANVKVIANSVEIKGNGQPPSPTEIANFDLR